MLPNRLRDQLEGLRLHRRTCGNDVILCMYGGKANGVSNATPKAFEDTSGESFRLMNER